MKFKVGKLVRLCPISERESILVGIVAEVIEYCSATGLYTVKLPINAPHSYVNVGLARDQALMEEWEVQELYPHRKRSRRYRVDAGPRTL